MDLGREMSHFSFSVSLTDYQPMRDIVQRMISSGSLSAFSVSASNGAIGGPRPVQNVQAQRGPQQQAAPAGQASPSRPIPHVNPGQTMPRGSLLDLSV
jgi:hypothetical protein